MYTCTSVYQDHNINTSGLLFYSQDLWTSSSMPVRKKYPMLLPRVPHLNTSLWDKPQTRCRRIQTLGVSHRLSTATGDPSMSSTGLLQPHVGRACPLQQLRDPQPHHQFSMIYYNLFFCQLSTCFSLQPPPLAFDG